MERGSLAADSGMLFTYPVPQSPRGAFWMYRTRIPLDIAFIDSAGIIRSIRSMEPCASTIPQLCPIYPAGVVYQAALEVNRGYFARHGVEIGARVLAGQDGACPHS